MPIHADLSPNIKWPLPEGKKAFSINNVFSQEQLSSIRDNIELNAHWGDNNPSGNKYHTIGGRWTMEIEFPKDIWDHVEKTGRSNWGNDDLRLKIIWLARYQQVGETIPYLWEHMDQSASQYTMDICIDRVGMPSWGLYIDEERFEDEENSAILFMAQQQAHSRPEYPVDNPEAYLVLMFAQFATPDHWIYDIDAYDKEVDPHLRSVMERYRSDGDIRYYEHSGHAPRFDNIPEKNVPCEDCLQCYVPPADFVYDIEGYVHLK